MTRDTSHRTRMSFLTIRLAMDSWVTPRRTLASPHLDLHHHPSSLRRPSLLALHQTSRTRCSPLLSVLTHFGMRLRSTESSLLRTWRPCVLTCAQFWPIRPSFSSSSRLCRPNSHSSSRSTSHRHRHHSDLQGSPLPSMFIFYQWGHWIFSLGGGGGGGVVFCYVYFSLFCFHCFGFSSL